MTLAAGVAASQFINGAAKTQVIVRRPQPTVPHAISLNEAWDLTLQQAHNWRTDAVLAQLSSSDVNDSPSDQSGLDGKRRTWQAVFIAASSPSQQLRVRITDGVVVDAVQQPRPLTLVTVIQKPTVDSPSAVAAVLAAKPGFGSGLAKARGIHFSVSLRSETGATIIRVIGLAGGEPAFVDVDGSTGTVVDAKRQTYGSTGGVLYSRDGGLTWQASSLTGQTVTSISANPDTNAADGFASVAHASGIVVYRTSDGGATWVESGRLPEEAGTWPFAILAFRSGDVATVTLLVGTRAGLWASQDGGAAWSRVGGLPPGSAWQIGAVKSSQGRRIFVTVVSGSANAALFSSTDLVTWTREANGAFRLSQSIGRESLLAIDESQPGQGLRFGFEGRTVVNLGLPSAGAPVTTGRPPVLRVGGVLDGSGPVISEAPDRIQFSEDSGLTWRVTLEADLASVAVAPDFVSSGVALAGGFRSGIHRTTSGGRTWALVVDEPSNLVSGNGEIVAVEFLSANHAVAVNGGGLVWRGF